MDWHSLNTTEKSHWKELRTVESKILFFPIKYWDLCQHFINFVSDILIVEIFHKQVHALSDLFSLRIKGGREKLRAYMKSLLKYSVFIRFSYLKVEGATFENENIFILQWIIFFLSGTKCVVFVDMSLCIDLYYFPENFNVNSQQNSVLCKRCLDLSKVIDDNGLMQICWQLLSISNISEYICFSRGLYPSTKTS